MSQFSINGRAINEWRAAIPSKPSQRQGDLSHTRHPRVMRTLRQPMQHPPQQLKEGDLLLGRGLTQIATIVERTTRFTVLVALPGRDMHTVTAGLSAQMTKLPAQLRRSLTWDRGMELAGHKRVTVNTGLQVYFADPKSPWQRGTNENTNRLLRQYFPKGTSIADFTQDDLDAIAAKLNTRPRQTLDFETPADRLQALLR
jgi:IS30 family transposase